MITDFVRWGNIGAYQMIEVDCFYKDFVEMIKEESSSFSDS